MLRENMRTKQETLHRERKNKLANLSDEEEIIERCRTYCFPMVAHDGLIVYAAEHQVKESELLLDQKEITDLVHSPERARRRQPDAGVDQETEWMPFLDPKYGTGKYQGKLQEISPRLSRKDRHELDLRKASPGHQLLGEAATFNLKSHRALPPTEQLEREDRRQVSSAKFRHHDAKFKMPTPGAAPVGYEASLLELESSAMDSQRDRATESAFGGVDGVSINGPRKADKKVDYIYDTKAAASKPRRFRALASDEST